MFVTDREKAQVISTGHHFLWEKYRTGDVNRAASFFLSDYKDQDIGILKLCYFKFGRTTLTTQSILVITKNYVLT